MPEIGTSQQLQTNTLLKCSYGFHNRMHVYNYCPRQCTYQWVFVCLYGCWVTGWGGVRECVCVCVCECASVS